MKLPRTALIARIHTRLKEIPKEIADATEDLVKARNDALLSEKAVSEGKKDLVSLLLAQPISTFTPVYCSEEVLYGKHRSYGSYKPVLEIEIKGLSANIFDAAKVLDKATTRHEWNGSNLRQAEIRLKQLKEKEASETKSLTSMAELLSESTEDEISLHSKKFKTLLENLL